jgi:hypothetical protein
MMAWSSTVSAQSIGEVWSNLTIDWLASERTVYTLDIEPKVQVGGDRPFPVCQRRRLA